MLGLGNTLSGGAALDEFTAASISGLDLWYDFSTLTGSNGDAVSSFTNAGDGGSDYDLSQGTGSLQPNLDTSELALNSLDFDDDRFDLNLGQRYGISPENAQVNGSYYINDETGYIYFMFIAETVS